MHYVALPERIVSSGEETEQRDGPVGIAAIAVAPPSMLLEAETGVEERTVAYEVRATKEVYRSKRPFWSKLASFIAVASVASIVVGASMDADPQADQNLAQALWLAPIGGWLITLPAAIDTGYRWSQVAAHPARKGTYRTITRTDPWFDTEVTHPTSGSLVVSARTSSDSTSCLNDKILIFADGSARFPIGELRSDCFDGSAWLTQTGVSRAPGTGKSAMVLITGDVEGIRAALASAERAAAEAAAKKEAERVAAEAAARVEAEREAKVLADRTEQGWARFNAMKKRGTNPEEFTAIGELYGDIPEIAAAVIEEGLSQIARLNAEEKSKRQASLKADIAKMKREAARDSAGCDFRGITDQWGMFGMTGFTVQVRNRRSYTVNVRVRWMCEDGDWFVATEEVCSGCQRDIKTRFSCEWVEDSVHITCE